MIIDVTKKDGIFRVYKCPVTNKITSKLDVKRLPSEEGSLTYCSELEIKNAFKGHELNIIDLDPPPSDNALSGDSLAKVQEALKKKFQVVNEEFVKPASITSPPVSQPVSNVVPINNMLEQYKDEIKFKLLDIFKTNYTMWKFSRNSAKLKGKTENIGSIAIELFPEIKQDIDKFINNFAISNSNFKIK